MQLSVLHLPLERFTARIEAQDRDFCLPHLHSTLLLGGFCRNIAMPFCTEKLEWLGYPTVKKFWRYVYSFWHSPRTYWMDRHTGTAWRLRQKRVLSMRIWKSDLFLADWLICKEICKVYDNNTMYFNCLTKQQLSQRNSWKQNKKTWWN